MAYVYFAVICLLFGSNFKFMDDATEVLGPMSIGLGRLWGGAAVLLVVLFFSKHRLLLDTATLVKILIVSLLANAYPFAVQPWILSQGTDHSFLAMFVPLTPLLTIVAAVPMLGVRPTWQQLAGVFGGLALLLWISSDAESHHLALELVPLAATVPLSYAIGNTFLRRHLQGVPSLVVSTYLLVFAGATLLPLAVYEVVRNPPQANAATWQWTILVMLILGPLGTGACIGLFVQLVQQRGPLFAGMVTYVVPVVALAWGYSDGEMIHTAQLAGIAGLLAMVALVQSSQANYAVVENARR
jgi:drug/metabolite transporter (DMT)-like permease